MARGGPGSGDNGQDDDGEGGYGIGWECPNGECFGGQGNQFSEQVYAMDIKRDKLVSGLLTIHAVHVRKGTKTDKDYYKIDLVDKASDGSPYVNGLVGHYLSMNQGDSDTDYIFWFKGTTTTAAPSLPNLTEVDISDSNTFVSAEAIADILCREINEFVTPVSYWYATVGDEVGTVHIMNKFAGNNFTGGDVSITVVGCTAVASGINESNEITFGEESDFKQGLYDYSGGDDDRRSPYFSNECPPWDGEIYSSGQHHLTGGDLSRAHISEGRGEKGVLENLSKGRNWNENNDLGHNACTGDYATFLYYVTIGTKIQDKKVARLWGLEVRNYVGSNPELLNHGGYWIGDFDESADVTRWTVASASDTAVTFIPYWDGTQTQEGAGPGSGDYSVPDVDSSPLGTGALELYDKTGAVGSVSKQVSLIATRSFKIAYSMQTNLNTAVETDAKCSIEVRTTASPSSAYIPISSGDVIVVTANGERDQINGNMHFTVDASFVGSIAYVHFKHTHDVIGQKSWLHSAALIQTSSTDIFYQDDLNEKFNRPMGSRWYTEKPDDGASYFFIRSHLLSHHNNAEEYSDNFEIISKRVQFWGAASGEISENSITFGWTGKGTLNAVGSTYWHKDAREQMDNYNYKKFKDWKPGDIISIAGADDSRNNGTFRIADYDWHNKTLYDQAASGTQTGVDNPEYNYGYNISSQYPSLDIEDVFPRMAFRIAKLRLDDDDDDGSDPAGAWKPHSMRDEKFYGQVYQQDLSTGSQGTGYPSTNGYRPLIFIDTSTDDDLGELCNIEGYIYIGDNALGQPGHVIGGDILITKPGHTGLPAGGFTALSSTQASRMRISLDPDSSNSNTIINTRLSEVPNDFTEDITTNGSSPPAYTTGDWTTIITEEKHLFIENQVVIIDDSADCDGTYEIVNVSDYTFDIENDWSGTGDTSESGDATARGSGGVPLTGSDIQYGGSGYSSTPTISFDNTGTGGSGAVAYATMGGGAVTGITFTNFGSGYELLPDIVFAGGGYTNTARARGVGVHVIDHTVTYNMVISNWITITNLTRKYQDSSNSKIFDRSIPNLRVDAPPNRTTYTAANKDTHANPINGRWGNTGRVSTRNHGHDGWTRKSSADYPGPGFVSGDRNKHYKEMFEYEGRWANQHKLETFHNPVPFPPEIYGNRYIGSMSRNVYSPMIYDAVAKEWVYNTDYMPIFGDGSCGEDSGPGYKLYPSTEDVLWCVSQMTKSTPQLVVEVPIKGYLRTMRGYTGEVGDWDIAVDILYDVDVQVFWQPYGETKEVKLALAGSSTVEGL